MSCATLYTDLMTPSFTPSGISCVMNGRVSSIKAIPAKGSCPMAIVWVGDRRCHLMKCNDLPVPLLKSEKATNNWLKGQGDVLAEETFHDRQDQAVIYVKQRRQRPRDATKRSRGCATEKLSENEIHDIADTASKNGFRTQAEEDEANELAISQALWELAQEDEMASSGGSYITSSPAEKVMSGGGNASVFGNRSSNAGRSSTTTSRDDNKRPAPPRADEESFWVCSVCTLHNPQSFLCCDACGAERSETTLNVPVRPRQPGPRPAVIDLTNSPPKKKTKAGEASRTAQTTQRQPLSTSASVSTSAPAPAPPRPSTWRCEYCATEMERQWWTCSNCGQMKFNSR
ncbi:uncharacterized protein TrAtP1_005987 [Trichoderma atroviride]|uniref:uncharacterized protein n=1 Tax=Hypocrea atroviridis TaxID=63577 RepID=UPI0033280BAE|nr:hypothetical protein TrAtP1_005987 [Trichoderma atroviride]